MKAAGIVLLMVLTLCMGAAWLQGFQGAPRKTVDKTGKKTDEEIGTIERELLKSYEAKAKPPDGLVKAYAAFVYTVRKNPTAKGLKPHCLPKCVAISPDERDKPGYGEGINLPFLKTGFRPEIRKLEKLDEDCVTVQHARTNFGPS
jgi:hypothetical protein